MFLGAHLYEKGYTEISFPIHTEKYEFNVPLISLERKDDSNKYKLEFYDAGDKENQEALEDLGWSVAEGAIEGALNGIFAGGGDVKVVAPGSLILLIVVCVIIYVVIEEIKWAERHWDDPHYEYELKAGHGAWFNEDEYDKAGHANQLDLFGYRFWGLC